jgi:hypothetical protein
MTGAKHIKSRANLSEMSKQRKAGRFTYAGAYFPVAYRIPQYRFPAPYAKIDIETQNEKSGGKTL